MGDWMPHGFNSQKEWEEFILSRGCYDARENEQIFNKWYARAPRVAFRRVDSPDDLRSKAICDVGCCYGANLFFTEPGSYGLEIDNRDVVKDDLSDLPRVDAVWCSTLIEYVDAPRTLLRELHKLLKTGGLLFLFAPIFPLIPALRHLLRYGKTFTSHLHDDHVSSFRRHSGLIASAQALRRWKSRRSTAGLFHSSTAGCSYRQPVFMSVGLLKAGSILSIRAAASMATTSSAHRIISKRPC